MKVQKNLYKDFILSLMFLDGEVCYTKVVIKFPTKLMYRKKTNYII